MSVDCDAELMYGWYVKSEEIPDFDLHCKNDWEDLFDIANYNIVLNGEETDLWPHDVVVCDNDYVSPEEADWYIGIPLANGLSKDDFTKQLDDSQAREIYRHVMGYEPDTPPDVLLFSHWC